MAEFKVGDWVEWDGSKGQLAKPVGYAGGTRIWLVRTSDASGTRDETVVDSMLRPAPLAEFEPLIAHEVMRCRLALACTYGADEFEIRGEIVRGLHKLVPSPVAYNLGYIIMARATAGFEYSNERRESLLAAIRAETERLAG